MTPKPVKMWAVVDPKGIILPDTVRKIKEDRFDGCLDKFWEIVNDVGFDGIETWPRAKKAGYRLVRVTVTIEE